MKLILPSPLSFVENLACTNAVITAAIGSIRSLDFDFDSLILSLAAISAIAFPIAQASTLSPT